MSARGLPPEFPLSSAFSVTLNGMPAAVAHTGPADFVSFSMDRAVRVEIEAAADISHAVVRPLSMGIRCEAYGRRVELTLDRPGRLWVDCEGLPPLFLFADPPAQTVTGGGDRHVRRLESGRVYDLGEVVLESGQTLCIEAGAVLRGCVRAKGVSDVAVCGAGIIDGRGLREQGGWRRGVLLEDCEGVRVEGVTIVNPPGWTLVFAGCRDVTVGNVKEIAEGFGTDGIDVVSSRNVVVRDCFLRNGDDNLVVKAFGAAEGRGRGGDVEGVLFERCTLLGHGGCAMEIGHELRADEIRDITFRDCDVLCVHGHAAVFGIHNADHARVRNVRYENIRVEHHFSRLADLRVITSRWGRDTQRGRIENIHFRNIRVLRSEYNDGYTVSLIGGYDSAHPVCGVLFEDFFIDGGRVTNADQMDLYTKHATGIEFR